MSKKILFAIDGERRYNSRLAPTEAGKKEWSLNINSKFDFLVTIAEINFGRLTVLCKDNLEVISHLLGEKVTLFIPMNEESPYVDGVWEIILKRVNKDKTTTLVFEKKRAIPYAFLDSLIHKDAFLLDSSHSFFKMNNHDDAKEISELFTDVKSFETEVSCDIMTKSQTITSRFNFESNLKFLEKIELSLSSESLNILKEEQEIFISFVFHTVKYFFKSLIIDIDQDFKILTLSLPKYFLALTQRRFESWPVHENVIISTDSSRSECILTSLSHDGGVISLKGLLDFRNQELTLITRSGNLKIHNFQISKKKLFFNFSKNKNTKKTLRKLVRNHLQAPFIERKPSNYDLFMEILERVGYGKGEKIKNHSYVSWKLQDELLPGNTIGVMFGERLVGSVSTIPLSQRAVYSHSLAMEKDLESIRYAYDMISHGMGWVNLLSEDTSYFSGSASLKSRFSTKLFFTYKGHTKPNRFVINRAYALKICDIKKTSKNNLKLIKTNQDFQYNGKFKNLLKLISENPTTTKSVHFVDKYSITKGNQTVALVIKHTVPHKFTAADVLRCVWVISLGNIDIDEVQSILLEGLDLDSNYEIDFIGFNTPPNNTHTPIFWYFIHHTEFALALASLSRTTYNVLRKYGSDAIPYLSRVVG